MEPVPPSLFRRGLLGVVLLLFPAVLPAAEPFYDRLLENGTRALERQDYAAATRTLHLACFGLLDEVDRLAVCLSRLAVAQAETGDEDAFRKTFDRLLEIERRFEALSRLELDPAVHTLLEGHLYRLVPYETLKGLPPFAQVARQQLEEKVVGLPVSERRELLEELLAGEPDNLSWRILMAEVDLESKNFEAAAAGSDRVLSRDAELLKAICIRGQSRAALNRCEGALIDLYTCDERHALEYLNRLKVRCHLALGQFDQAESMARYLPSRERRSLEREITLQRQKASSPQPSSVASEPSAGEEGSPPPPP